MSGTLPGKGVYGVLIVLSIIFFPISLAIECYNKCYNNMKDKIWGETEESSKK